MTLVCLCWALLSDLNLEGTCIVLDYCNGVNEGLVNFSSARCEDCTHFQGFMAINTRHTASIIALESSKATLDGTSKAAGAQGINPRKDLTVIHPLDRVIGLQLSQRLHLMLVSKAAMPAVTYSFSIVPDFSSSFTKSFWLLPSCASSQASCQKHHQQPETLHAVGILVNHYPNLCTDTKWCLWFVLIKTSVCCTSQELFSSTWYGGFDFKLRKKTYTLPISSGLDCQLQGWLLCNLDRIWGISRSGVQSWLTHIGNDQQPMAGL